uniref:Putative tick transposon n=1 Tax=Rhipicephalus pulchellus TaxID=72859 RepID=L7LZB9_RHIPC
MSVKYHKGRRAARARALQRQFGHHRDVYYTDACKIAKDKYTVVATNQSSTITATVRTASVNTAESAAIALAIRDVEYKTQDALVISDSQSACRQYLTGAVSKITTAKILGTHIEQYHAVISCPAHAGLEGNEKADGIARGISIRAPIATVEEPPVTPRDILQTQRKERQKFIPTHPKLDIGQDWDWRRLQTNTYPNLLILNKIHPTQYPDTCPWCWERPSLTHIMWTCRLGPPEINSPLFGRNPFERQWEVWLASKDQESQVALLDQAQQAAKASGALD